MLVLHPPQIDDVIDEIISLESSYEDVLSFGPPEAPLPLPNTVRWPFKRGGGASANPAQPAGTVGRGLLPYKALGVWLGAI